MLTIFVLVQLAFDRRVWEARRGIHITPTLSSLKPHLNKSSSRIISSEILPAVREVPDHLQLLARNAATLKMHSKAKSTWAAYERAFQRFQLWCTSHGLSALPATEQSVEFYLADLAFSKESVPALELTFAAIGALHNFHAFPNPCTSVSVRLILQGAKRCFGKPPVQKRPMKKEDLRKLLNHWLSESVRHGSLLDWRSAWLESTLYHASARWSDIAKLRVKNFQISDRDMTIVFNQRKNDQLHRGHSITIHASNSTFCPVALTKRYFRVLGPEYTGFVIPRIWKVGDKFRLDGSISATYQSCRKEQAAGLRGVGLDPTEYGLHSGRIGSSVILRNASFSMNAISRRVGWAPNSSSVFRYTKLAKEEFSAMNRALKL